MRHLAVACLLIMLPSASAQHTEAGLIQTQTPFTKDGVITHQPAQTLAGVLKVGPSTVERGALNGVAYQVYYSDGSGRFAGTPGNVLVPIEDSRSNWSVDCRKDAITDDKSCHMYRGDFWVFVQADGKPMISIGSNHYPGSDVFIRIDKSPAMVKNTRALGGSFTYSDSQKIINLIAKGKTVTTRFQKWPEVYNRDADWEVYGFNEALSYIKWAVARIK